MNVAILGGGASGMACAIQLKHLVPQAKVTIYEKNDQLGKKILATGNGRCNLTNEHMTASCFYGDAELVKTVLGLSEGADPFLTEDCIRFFKDLGLFTTSEEGRVYPRTMTAASVRTVLVNELKRLRVQVVTGYTVESLDWVDNQFVINGKEHADKVVLALGGKAGAQYGTDGDAYRMLKHFGIRYNPIAPALVGIKVEENLKALHGVRVRGSVTMRHEDGTPFGTHTGELQLTESGISGIAAMQLSSPAAVLSKSESPVLELDFFPEQSFELFAETLLSLVEQHPEETVADLLSGMLNAKLITAVLSRAGIASEVPAGGLSLEQLSSLMKEIKAFRLHITGTKSYKEAQTTHGGVPSTMLNRGSLEAAGTKGLYFTGELLDVDGICGGYNLHFAWASGIHAAEELAEKFYGKENLS